MSAPFPPGFSGIDPILLDAMIGEFRRTRADLTGTLSPYRARLGPLGVPRTALRDVELVCSWIDAQLPMLIRRRDLAIALDDCGQPGLASVDESLILTPSEARRHGAALAKRFKDGSLHELLNELGPHRFDGDYTAAFFAALGTKLTLGLPSRIAEHGRDGHVGRQLRETSQAFATAVSSGTRVPGFGTVARSLFNPDLSPDDRRNAAALVSSGAFPPEWLASLARLHALDPLHRQAAARPDMRAADLTATDWETVRRMLRALANNPVASRLAFQEMAAEERGLAPVLTTFTRMATLDPETATQLGRAFAAASSERSTNAATFAFTVITTVPKTTVSDNMRLPLAQIAGTYATEITEGANIDDRTQGTAFGRVQTYTPGLKPMFSLSPQDTYAFLKTFADSPTHMRPFEQGMSDLTRRLGAEGIRLEIAKGKGDLPHGTPGLERVMQALGYVAGLQSQAQHTVQGRLDERDANRREDLAKLPGLAFDTGAVFLPMAPMVDENLWGLVRQAAEGHISRTNDTAADNTRISRLESRELQLSLGLQHSVVQRLLSGGYPLKVRPADFTPPHPDHPFTTPRGRLLPYDQLTKDTKALDNYVTWLETNGRGGHDDDAFGQVAVRASGAFAGKQHQASHEAANWEANEKQ
ncbi:hypothetical protein [Spirillospora sp. CA-294931]|uniref:hypothetical protein n=1 Tax=Spirillospora sp. CA-294931 TaxID=3240042 RepID=UPI003D8DF6B5